MGLLDGGSCSGRDASDGVRHASKTWRQQHRCSATGFGSRSSYYSVGSSSPSATPPNEAVAASAFFSYTTTTATTTTHYSRDEQELELYYCSAETPSLNADDVSNEDLAVDSDTEDTDDDGDDHWHDAPLYEEECQQRRKTQNQNQDGDECKQSRKAQYQDQDDEDDGQHRHTVDEINQELHDDDDNDQHRQNVDDAELCKEECEQRRKTQDQDQDGDECEQSRKAQYQDQDDDDDGQHRQTVDEINQELHDDDNDQHRQNVDDAELCKEECEQSRKTQYQDQEGDECKQSRKAQYQNQDDDDDGQHRQTVDEINQELHDDDNDQHRQNVHDAELCKEECEQRRKTQNQDQDGDECEQSRKTQYLDQDDDDEDDGQHRQNVDDADQELHDDGNDDDEHRQNVDDAELCKEKCEQRRKTQDQNQDGDVCEQSRKTQYLDQDDNDDDEDDGQHRQDVDDADHELDTNDDVHVRQHVDDVNHELNNDDDDQQRRQSVDDADLDVELDVDIIEQLRPYGVRFIRDLCAYRSCTCPIPPLVVAHYRALPVVSSGSSGSSNNSTAICCQRLPNRDDFGQDPYGDLFMQDFFVHREARGSTSGVLHFGGTFANIEYDAVLREYRLLNLAGRSGRSLTHSGSKAGFKRRLVNFVRSFWAELTATTTTTTAAIPTTATTSATTTTATAVTVLTTTTATIAATTITTTAATTITPTSTTNSGYCPPVCADSQLLVLSYPTDTTVDDDDVSSTLSEAASSAEGRTWYSGLLKDVIQHKQAGRPVEYPVSLLYTRNWLVHTIDEQLDACTRAARLGVKVSRIEDLAEMSDSEILAEDSCGQPMVPNVVPAQSLFRTSARHTLSEPPSNFQPPLFRPRFASINQKPRSWRERTFSR